MVSPSPPLLASLWFQPLPPSCAPPPLVAHPSVACKFSQIRVASSVPSRVAFPLLFAISDLDRPGPRSLCLQKQGRLAGSIYAMSRPASPLVPFKDARHAAVWLVTACVAPGLQPNVCPHLQVANEMLFES
jgi:hypothetical protein